MNKMFVPLLMGIALLGIPSRSTAQWQELQQLYLDMQKLTQMKALLKEMYQGYQILTNGYNTVKNLAQGNFNLHDAFLTSLLKVNPTIKKYARIADVVQAQATLVKEYKAARKKFAVSGAFSVSELNYITGIYSDLFDKSLEDLDQLIMILTNDSLRMSDAERLSAIDRLYDQMQEKLTFLRHFNGKAAVMGSQRQQQLHDISILKSLFGN